MLIFPRFYFFGHKYKGHSAFSQGRCVHTHPTRLSYVPAVYHFNQSEWSIIHQNKAKVRKFPWKPVLGTAVRPTIFSNIQLIKKKFDSNIDGHMKEQSWNNESCGFIVFKVMIKNPPWKNIKDHISARKGSVTYKNFQVFMRNLTHS